MGTAYLTISEAQDYFDERLNTYSWDNADDATKDKALLMASKAVDALNYVGSMTSSTQVLQFPRGGDTSVPQNILDAVCLLALRFLDDVDLEMEFRNLQVSKSEFASVKTTYDGSYHGEHVSAGIPSYEAWILLKPYLRDARGVTLVRVN